MSILNNIKKKVIDTTSTAIANNFMGGNQAKAQMASDDQLSKDMQLVKKTKGVSMAGKDYNDPIFRARANVSNFEAEYANKRAKANQNK